MGKQWIQWLILFLGAPKSLQVLTAAMKLRSVAPWKKSYDQSRQHIKKQRHYFPDKGPSSQSREGNGTHSSTLAWKIPWTEEPGRLQSMGSLSRTRLSDFPFTFHFHALEREMATHSNILAWRIPGTEEPVGLPSMGSHRVRHDWHNLAAAAAAEVLIKKLNLFVIIKTRKSPGCVRQPYSFICHVSVNHMSVNHILVPTRL